MVKAIICALSLLPLTFALGLINDGRVHHHSPLFHHRAHTRISQTRYNPSRKNKSCIYQSGNSNDYFLEKVEEKSVLEEMQESFMELKEKASKALTRAQNDELSES